MAPATTPSAASGGTLITKEWLVADSCRQFRFLALSHGQRQNRKTHYDGDDVVRHIAGGHQHGDHSICNNLPGRVDKPIDAKHAAADRISDFAL